MSEAHVAEKQFYSRYSWCLNPILSIEELLQGLREGVDQYPPLTGWEREESQSNIYLLACGITCTLDDYLAKRLAYPSPLRIRSPQSGFVFIALEWSSGL